MIEHIENKNIDFEKYDNCIQNSLFPLIYAESWYLDIGTRGNWDILMANDYEFVMPLPYLRLKKSFWKRTLLTPYHAQQLGVIGRSKLTKELNDGFVSALLKLVPLEYSFNNAQNAFLDTNVFQSKNNFVLDLQPSYDDLFKNFSRSKRSTIRQAKKNRLMISEYSDVKSFIQFQKVSLSLKESWRVLNKRSQLIQTALDKNLGKLYIVQHANTTVGAAFFGFYRNKIYYLQSASNNDGRKLLAMDFLLNHVIEQNAEKPYYLDFEGSQIPGVAKFVKSFGAENHPYYVITN